MSATLLDVYVPGTPRPKGSMRSVGKGRMVESLAGSGDWRAAVAFNARARLDSAVRDGYGTGPYLGPVAVVITLCFVAPKKPGSSYPGNRSTGDADKHARNILDALQDAGVYKDDAQVVDLTVRKRYGVAAGASIVVRTVAE